MSEPATATVEVLTAEVRTLQVGNRQVTLSVYRQLDDVDSDLVEPFGRVSDSKDEGHYQMESVFVVGRHKETGALVRSCRKVQRKAPTKNILNVRLSNGRHREYSDEELKMAITVWEQVQSEVEEWKQLPKIVLAGLR